jgi:1-acyl-sn-glycerol-3-phosphate acyltransferase
MSFLKSNKWLMMMNFLIIYLQLQYYSFTYLISDLITHKNSFITLLKFFSLDVLQIKPYKHKDSHDLYKNKEKHCIYICNHVSFTDFFFDGYLTQGACYISRFLVILAIPFSAFYAFFSEGIIFIIKGKKNTKKKLIEKMKNKIQINDLLLYPEGTRNTTDQKLPLKLTCVEFAYESNTKIQIIISSNKRHVLDEKQWKINKNTKILVYYSHVFDPSEYSNLNDFKTDIVNEWNKIYDLVNQNNFDSSKAII